MAPRLRDPACAGDFGLGGSAGEGPLSQRIVLKSEPTIIKNPARMVGLSRAMLRRLWKNRPYRDSEWVLDRVSGRDKLMR